MTMGLTADKIGLMKVDGKTILEEAKADQPSDRKSVTLYLSESLYKTFKKQCGDTPGSIVVERLIREFVNSMQKPKKG